MSSEDQEKQRQTDHDSDMLPPEPVYDVVDTSRRYAMYRRQLLLGLFSSSITSPDFDHLRAREFGLRSRLASIYSPAHDTITDIFHLRTHFKVFGISAGAIIAFVQHKFAARYRAIERLIRVSVRSFSQEYGIAALCYLAFPSPAPTIQGNSLGKEFLPEMAFAVREVANPTAKTMRSDPIGQVLLKRFVTIVADNVLHVCLVYQWLSMQSIERRVI